MMLDTVALTPVKLEVFDVLTYAFRLGASDIHIEPTKNTAVIRFRCGGLMRDVRVIPPNRKNSFLDEAISFFGLLRHQVHVEQKTRFEHPNEPVDYRISVMPSLHGPRFCLRLLERNKTFHLDAYPMPDDAKEYLTRTIMRGYGLILISGPTGSGKTTLLYSALGSIDRLAKTVFTVEDPVEYSLPRVTQVPISGSYGFADALRTLMRQDPQVIMVGEIRDEETAHAAIKAASTGNLVFSTIHANDVNDIFKRFEGLGVSRLQVEPVLLYASAQRLQPKLCSSCRVEDDHLLAKELALEITGTDFIPFTSKGCVDCNNLKYSGRVLLYEWGIPTNQGFKIQGTLKEAAKTSLVNGDVDAYTAFECVV